MDLLEENRVGGVAAEVCRAVMGWAGPREVVVLHTVRDLVAGSSLSFEERGAAAFGEVPNLLHLYLVKRC